MSVTRLNRLTSTAVTMKMPSNSGLSRPCTASQAKVPTPGQENTFSTSTLPPTNIEACKPAKVTSGMAALRRIWRAARHHAFTQPLCARGLDEILVGNLDHGGAGQPCVAGEKIQRQGHAGQDHV